MRATGDALPNTPTYCSEFLPVVPSANNPAVPPYSLSQVLSVDAHSATSTSPICLTGFSQVDPTLVAPPNYSSNRFTPIKVATLPARLPCPLLVHTWKSSSVRLPSPPATLQLYTRDMQQCPATIVAMFIPETILRVWERGPLLIVPLPPSSVSQLCIDDVSIELLPLPLCRSRPSTTYVSVLFHHPHT